MMQSESPGKPPAARTSSKALIFHAQELAKSFLKECAVDRETQPVEGAK
jgi:hypothetical protein